MYWSKYIFKKLSAIIYYLYVRHDRKLGGDISIQTTTDHAFEPLLPTQQFGVTLQFIRDNYHVSIPPVVTQCIEYMDNPDGM